jgi:hypothetical protein
MARIVILQSLSQSLFPALHSGEVVTWTIQRYLLKLAHGHAAIT